MEILISIAIFIFGAIIGSFLNVVIYRYHSGQTLLGRSFCFSCRKELVWYELIPILSFFIQKGKCRHCQSKISWQYPLVEILTGMIFLLIISKYGFLISNWVNIIFYWIIFSILIIITFYDFRHKIIPDKLVYAFIILSFFFPIFQLGISNFNLEIWSYFLAGPVLALPLALLWFVSRGRWMGFGDVKLVLGIGFLLGLSRGTASLLIAFWSGAIIGIGLILISKKFKIKSEIPFAPFLILGTLIVFLWNIDLKTLILDLPLLN